MYGWIFRHLPGPKWLKVVWSLLLLTLVVWLLFTYVYPPIHAHFNQVTVD